MAISKAIMFFGALVASLNVHAWQPCLPFCDAGCSGMAMTKFSADTVSSVSQYQSKCLELTNALGESSQEFANLTADLSESFFSKHTETVTALDGLTSKLTMTFAKRAKVHSTSADLLVNTFVSKIRELSKVASYINTDAIYGTRGQFIHPYLFKGACTDCTDEPISMLLDLSKNLNKRRAQYSLIAFESSGEASNSQLKSSSQIEWVQDHFNESLDGEKQARLNGFLSVTGESKSPRAKAIRKLKSVLQGVQIANKTEIEQERYTHLNLATFTKGKSFDSVLRGQEAYAVADDMTGVMRQTDHGLLLRQAFTQTATNINLLKLNLLGRQGNLYLALRLLDADDNE